MHKLTISTSAQLTLLPNKGNNVTTTQTRAKEEKTKPSSEEADPGLSVFQKQIELARTQMRKALFGFQQALGTEQKTTAIQTAEQQFGIFRRTDAKNTSQQSTLSVSVSHLQPSSTKINSLKRDGSYDNFKNTQKSLTHINYNGILMRSRSLRTNLQSSNNNKNRQSLTKDTKS